VRSGRRGCCGSLEVAIASVKALTLDLDDCRDFDATTSRNVPKSRDLGNGPRVALQGRMLTRAAALTAALALLSPAAFAGASAQRFTVGAVVVRSATVMASHSGVQQVASRGTPAPMLLVANELKPVTESCLTELGLSNDGYKVATVLY
jgi:hypothetical protein